jgi:branched-chain amino acid transport system substrate-binding protein
VFPAAGCWCPLHHDPKQKEVTQLIDTYQAKFGSPPYTFAGYAFEAVELLAAAIEKAGSTEPTAIQSALNSIQGFVMPDGTYNYSATDHDGLVAADMIMVKIQGGTWVLAE